MIIRSFLLVLFLFISTTNAYAETSPRNTPIVQVVKDRSPSVVNISTEKMVLLQYHPYWRQYGNIFDDSSGQHSRIPIGTMKLKGVGSGVIVSKEGLIATNAHVVNMTSKIYVILYDGESYEAGLIGVNQKDDLALIKIIPKKELKPVEFADDVMIGETVVSIGNPLGLENSVSAGIVSGTNRKFYSNAINNIVFDNLIQTDASINLGSSGGALFNLEGKLVGINLAIIQNAQNLGFAIPVEKIKGILKEYEAYKREKNIVKIPIQ